MKPVWSFFIVAALSTASAGASAQLIDSPNTIAGPALLVLKPGKSAVIYHLKVSSKVNERRIATFETNSTSNYKVVVQHKRKDKLLHATDPVSNSSSSVEFELQDNDSIHIVCEGQEKGDGIANIFWRVDTPPPKK